MIKQILFLTCFAGFAAAQFYHSPITDADLDGALRDRGYLESQIRCTLNEGPCDNVGKRLRSLAPFVLRGSCPQCSPGERRQIQRTLSYVQRNYPRDWNRLINTYSG